MSKTLVTEIFYPFRPDVAIWQPAGISSATNIWRSLPQYVCKGQSKRKKYIIGVSDLLGSRSRPESVKAQDLLLALVDGVLLEESALQNIRQYETILPQGIERSSRD